MQTRTTVSADNQAVSSLPDLATLLAGLPKGKAEQARTKPLKARIIDTLVGPMIAVGDRSQLVLLEFADRPGIASELAYVRNACGTPIEIGEEETLKRIEDELHAYAQGHSFRFKTEVKLLGTAFQTAVWRQLLDIPWGKTWSYKDLAQRLNKPSATRAVGRANGSNRLAIIVPCHRVVGSDGQLTGYGGGLWRKQRLLDLEGISSTPDLFD